MALGSNSSSNSNASDAGSSGTASGTSSSIGGGSPNGGNGNGGNGGNGGNNNAGSSAGNASAGATAAGTSTSGDSKNQGSSMSGSMAADTAGAQSTSATAGNVMGSLQSAVSAARDSRNAGVSGIQQGIAQAVANTFGGAAAATPTDNTTSPNATPGQKAAYNSGYRNETEAGLTRSAFGSVPGIGSLVGEGIARTAMSQPAGLQDNEKAAYATGVTGAKDAGVGTAGKALASTLGGVLGGPIGSALASLALGGYSYSQQRAANPQAFSGAGSTQTTGPISGTVSGAPSMGNSDNDVTMANVMSAPTTQYGLPSDYSSAYNSYQNMNLGNL